MIPVEKPAIPTPPPLESLLDPETSIVSDVRLVVSLEEEQVRKSLIQAVQERKETSERLQILRALGHGLKEQPRIEEQALIPNNRVQDRLDLSPRHPRTAP